VNDRVKFIADVEARTQHHAIARKMGTRGSSDSKHAAQIRELFRHDHRRLPELRQSCKRDGCPTFEPFSGKRSFTGMTGKLCAAYLHR
jgi:hypothetical protein